MKLWSPELRKSFGKALVWSYGVMKSGRRHFAVAAVFWKLWSCKFWSCEVRARYFVIAAILGDGGSRNSKLHDFHNSKT
jgi:hypothetical protein